MCHCLIFEPIYSYLINIVNNIQHTTQITMISYPYFCYPLMFFQDQHSNTSQLEQIKQIYFTQLTNQLQLNRILLNNTVCNLISVEPNCPSPSTQPKNECQLQQFTQQNQDEFQMESYQKNRKISKNKISHNSSLRNDTKNIPKNYGKAIMTFIESSPLTKKLATQMGIKYSDIMMQVRRIKKKVNSIQGLRRMWGSDNLEHKMKKCIRILSYEFMRKHGLEYIFHSKIRLYKTHIKYRQKLIEGIENPIAFNHIKDF